MVRSFRLQALAKNSIKKYSSDFKIASMAADALGLDPFNLSSDDLSYLAVFHALGHSIHSLDSFFSAIANVYKDLGKVLPRDHLFLATKRGLKRVFNPIDKILRAYPLSFDQVRLILSLLDSTSFDDVVFGFWLSLSFVWALRPDDWIHGRLTWGDIARRLDGGYSVTVYPGKGSLHHGAVTRELPSIGASAGVNPSYWLLCLIILLPSDFRNPDQPVFVRPSRSKGHDSYILVESSWFASKLLRCFSKTFDEPPPRKLTAYSARRGGATAYAKAGLQKSAIKEILRHKNEATTEDYIQTIASVADSLEVAEIFS